VARSRFRRSIAILPLLFLSACAERTPLGTSGSVPEAVAPPRISIIGPGGAVERFAPSEIVIEMSSSMDLATLNAVWGTSTIVELEDGVHALLALPREASVQDLCAELLQAGDCASAEPNWIAETPESVQGVMPFYEGGAVSQDVGNQDAMQRIRVAEAHEESQGAGIVVAILDTGIDASHPDLAASVSPLGWDFIDDDALPTDEADGIDQDGDGAADEGAGHGTHVAGLVHTVAPEATLMAVRVLDTEGAGTAVSVARGIRFAVENGAHVMNLSLGMYVGADVITDAIRDAEDAGVVAICAAGNRGVHDRDHFPSRLSKTVAVTATDADDFKAGFANFGPDVDLSAPGVGLLSTFLDHGYATWSGTSMATPLVAGAAALKLDVAPWTEPCDMREALGRRAFEPDYTGLVYEGMMGEGRLNVHGVVD
jgi:subtilisin family serine protease